MAFIKNQRHCVLLNATKVSLITFNLIFSIKGIKEIAFIKNQRHRVLLNATKVCLIAFNLTL